MSESSNVVPPSHDDESKKVDDFETAITAHDEPIPKVLISDTSKKPDSVDRPLRRFGKLARPKSDSIGGSKTVPKQTQSSEKSSGSDRPQASGSRPSSSEIRRANQRGVINRATAPASTPSLWPTVFRMQLGLIGLIGLIVVSSFIFMQQLTSAFGRAWVLVPITIAIFFAIFSVAMLGGAIIRGHRSLRPVAVFLAIIGAAIPCSCSNSLIGGGVFVLSDSRIQGWAKQRTAELEAPQKMAEQGAKVLVAGARRLGVDFGEELSQDFVNTVGSWVHDEYNKGSGGKVEEELWQIRLFTNHLPISAIVFGAVVALAFTYWEYRTICADLREFKTAWPWRIGLIAVAVVLGFVFRSGGVVPTLFALSGLVWVSLALGLAWFSLSREAAALRRIPSASIASELERLHRLADSGALSAEEFKAAKGKALRRT